MAVAEALKSYFIEKMHLLQGFDIPTKKINKNTQCGPNKYTRPRKSTQVTTSMEDLALYNQGYKALSLLITILASVVMNRLLSRGPLGIGSDTVHEWRKCEAQYGSELHSQTMPGRARTCRV